MRISPSRLPLQALLFFVVLLIVPAAVSAQRKSAGDPAKLVKEADALYKQRKITEAEVLYKAAQRGDRTNTYIMLQLAHCYMLLDKPEQAVTWYTTATDAAPEKSDTAWFERGIAEKKIGEYEASTKSLNRFLELHKRNDYLLRQAKVELEGNEYGKAQLKLPPKYALEIANMNSKSGDFDPAIFSNNGKRFLIFTSHRLGSQGEEVFAENAEERYSDLWVSEIQDDSSFGKPENMGKTLNTVANDGTAVISADGTKMYLTICGEGKLGKSFGCSIYESLWDEDKFEWGTPEKVEGVNGSRVITTGDKGKEKSQSTYDVQPMLSADGNTLYFVSDRPGGQGGSDLWYSTLVGNTWTTPVNCGPTLNTEFEEIQPYCYTNGVLYFASTGHKGMGGYDIYRTEGSGTTWTTPENLGYPLNSSWDETSIVWYLPDSTGLLTTNRPDGYGRDDVYYVRKKPPVVIKLTVQGVVRDKNTRQAIPFATVTLEKVTPTGRTKVDTFRTDQSGRYQFNLEREQRYWMVASSPEYISNEDSVSTIGYGKSKRLERDIDIFLERIELTRPIVLQNIYFDYDKFELRAESKKELEKLATLLLENPGMTIQIDGHTDTNGPEDYNVKLSENRAKAAVDYLIELGVSVKRLRWFGYGESQPMIYPELSDNDEQSNRRTEFRIRTLDFKQAPAN